MRNLIGIVLILIVASGVFLCLDNIPFGASRENVGDFYNSSGVKQTGAVNMVTSVVLNYRGFDTLGEVTILFIASLGLGAVLSTVKTSSREETTPSSLILSTGCRFLFPFILLFGTYTFLHGHLTPGGGFQGGAIIASGFLLRYLGCPAKRTNPSLFVALESTGGLVFTLIGLLGLTLSGFFLFNFLPKGEANTLFSAGIIPVIYIAIGFKVGAELAGIIDGLIVKS